MRIIVDFSDPDNDVEIRGLAAGETPEDRLGPRGRPAWRLFTAAARLLFLVQQHIPAAADARDREVRFIQERLREIGGGKSK